MRLGKSSSRWMSSAPMSCICRPPQSGRQPPAARRAGGLSLAPDSCAWASPGLWWVTGSGRPAVLIEGVGELFAGLEERDVLLGDLDTIAGACVAPDPGIPALHRKGAEAAQLDPVAARQRRGDLVKNG